MKYLVHSPWWLRMWFPQLLWSKERTSPVVYLTFDDGPHPEITPWVMEQLASYDFKASFFLIGNNAQKYPAVVDQLKQAGHLIGNHTFNHVNGWKTDLSTYLEEVRRGRTYTGAHFFRPPYGRIGRQQAKAVIQEGYEVVMWDVVTGDFDRNISAQRCFKNVIRYTRAGSIVVFHDSEKAWPHLKEVLPQTLKWLSAQGLCSERLDFQ